jgi:hypothetical protein
MKKQFNWYVYRINCSGCHYTYIWAWRKIINGLYFHHCFACQRLLGSLDLFFIGKFKISTQFGAIRQGAEKFEERGR